MRRIFLLGMILSLVLSLNPCFAASPEKKAEICAKNWLELVDGKNYAKSYDNAASFFKTMVTKDDWINTMVNLRSMLRGMVWRKLISAKYETKMAGAPDGEYVVLIYKTRFNKKDDAREIVIPMLDTDGRWRVSGYYVK